VLFGSGVECEHVRQLTCFVGSFLWQNAYASQNLHSYHVGSVDSGGGMDFVACYIIDGQPVLNGDGHFLSREILANPEGCTSKTVAAVKKAFPGAEVVK